MAHNAIILLLLIRDAHVIFHIFHLCNIRLITGTCNLNKENHDIVEEELKVLLPHYEDFFGRVGFKRIDGAIFGLLCFSKRALTSNEIEETLELSQSAVSQSLKTLAQYSMIGFKDHRELKRQKLHFAKDDALSIVASILRKRELEYLSDFESMSKKALDLVGGDHRSERLATILNTATFAKTLTELIINVNKEFDNPYIIIEKFPLFISFLKTNVPTITEAKDQFKNSIRNKLNGWLSNIDGPGEAQ